MLFDSADIVESVFLGVALAMDAMAVTLANLLAEPHMPKAKKIAMPLAFAIFQMAMPVFGYFGGMLVASYIDAYAGIVSFVILGIVGGKMIWEALQEIHSQGEAASSHLTRCGSLSNPSPPPSMPLLLVFRLPQRVKALPCTAR